MISSSTLQIVEGAGHMVHHVATDPVAEAILTVSRTAREPVSGGALSNSGHSPEA
jgi:hypothetical protein